MIEGRNLSVVRRGKTLLAGVDVAVRPGELLAIVGPNGAGKSTLLRALTGALAAEGTVRLNGRPHPPLAERARTLAVLDSRDRLTFPLAVWAVVRLGRLPHEAHHPGSRNDAIAAAALRRVGMEALADRSMSTLSDGERRSVHLARVLAQIWDVGGSTGSVDEPDPRGGTLLLDEPIANLDLSRAARTMHLLKEFAALGAAVGLVVHDLESAAHFADRLLVLHRGTRVAEGPPAEVLQPRLLEEAWGIPFEQVGSRDGRPVFLPRYGASPHPSLGAPSPSERTARPRAPESP